MTENQPTLEQMAKTFNSMMQLIMEKAKGNGDGEWSLASEPFKNPELPKEQKYVRPMDSKSKKPFETFRTFTFLDQMFLDENDKPYDGIPFGATVLLTGLPNSGKSLLIEEIALKVANGGKKVVFVTSEEAFRCDTPRFDLENRLMEKAKLLGLDWQKIQENLFVIDTVMFAELREWASLVSTYRSLVETQKIDLLLVDSLTLLEDSRGQIKFRLLELCRYNQVHGVTSILINQRAIEEADTLAMAGGLGLSHICDIVAILDYKKVSSWDAQLKLDIPTAKQGQTINFFRILKCRMCRFDAHYKGYEITKDGLVRLNGGEV